MLFDDNVSTLLMEKQLKGKQENILNNILSKSNTH